MRLNSHDWGQRYCSVVCIIVAAKLARRSDVGQDEICTVIRNARHVEAEPRRLSNQHHEARQSELSKDRLTNCLAPEIHVDVHVYVYRYMAS